MLLVCKYKGKGYCWFVNIKVKDIVVSNYKCKYIYVVLLKVLYILITKSNVTESGFFVNIKTQNLVGSAKLYVQGKCNFQRRGLVKVLLFQMFQFPGFDLITFIFFAAFPFPNSKVDSYAFADFTCS